MLLPGSAQPGKNESHAEAQKEKIAQRSEEKGYGEEARSTRWACTVPFRRIACQNATKISNRKPQRQIRGDGRGKIMSREEFWYDILFFADEVS
jgi:hypothetical protein